MPLEDQALEDAIVAACTDHMKAHWKDEDYRACITFREVYFVKFGDAETLGPEIATQRYISTYAEEHPETPGMPRIPKVMFNFQRVSTMYMVMEYIQLAGSPPEPQMIADALRWLSKVPPPLGHVMGPLAGGRIRHGFFKDYKAPLAFSSVKALERYIEEARGRLSKLASRKTEPVKLSSDSLTFTQSDMHLSNFGVDEHGNTVLMDFQEIALLPESFAAYTMASSSLAPIAESLDLSGNPNTASMGIISSVLQMTGDARLGLDDHGYPKITRNSQAKPTKQEV